MHTHTHRHTHRHTYTHLNLDYPAKNMIIENVRIQDLKIVCIMEIEGKIYSMHSCTIPTNFVFIISNKSYVVQWMATLPTTSTKTGSEVSCTRVTSELSHWLSLPTM